MGFKLNLEQIEVQGNFESAKNKILALTNHVSMFRISVGV